MENKPQLQSAFIFRESKLKKLTKNKNIVATLEYIFELSTFTKVLFYADTLSYPKYCHNYFLLMKLLLL